MFQLFHASLRLRANQADTVYCRLHGCQPPPQRVRTALSQGKQLDWFAAGLDLGWGKEHKQVHMAMYKDSLKEKRERAR